MDFFRAVPSRTDVSKRHTRFNTRRLPSNIPYSIDNLWEFLRPANKPSRRHAVYASPSPELALANASAYTADTSEGYAAYALVFNHPPAFMQLSVTDARYHPDVKALQRIVHETLGAEFGALPLAQKLAVAPLFLPGVSADELRQAGLQCGLLQNILDQAGAASTFWDGKDVLDPMSEGELFFELDEKNSYVLQVFDIKAD